MLNRAAFLTALSSITLAPQAITIPELGGDVFIKTLTAKEREDYEDSLKDVPENSVRATIATQVVCDEKGKLLFTPEDVEALNNGSAKVLMRIFAKFNEINGVSEDEAKNAEKK